MSIIVWLALGLIAGLAAGKLYAGNGQGLIPDVVLGVIGAFVGGILSNVVGENGVTAFNLYSMFVAAVGALAVLWAYHTVTDPWGGGA